MGRRAHADWWAWGLMVAALLAAAAWRLGSAGRAGAQGGAATAPVGDAARLQATRAVQDLWQAIDRAAASGEAGQLAPLFADTAGGRAALEHARARLAYVQAWARARGVRWREPQVTVRLRSVVRDGTGRLRVTAVVSEAWTYAYPASGSRPPVTHTFGLGRVHRITLLADAAGWRIAADNYVDPLDQDSRIPGDALPAAGAPPPAVPRRLPGIARDAGRNPVAYDRAAAVRYADAYCGAAPGCGHDGRYNPAFHDYNAEGGDCTNFISQVLGVGGGLPRDRQWTFREPGGTGTAAWVNGYLLIQHLVRAGLARVVARGSYAQVLRAWSQLSPGDVVAYMEGGRTVHLAVLVGYDPRGYPLVDSHTADRYHVPWDIGWDRATVFLFVHVRDHRGTAHPAATLPPAASAGCA